MLNATVLDTCQCEPGFEGSPRDGSRVRERDGPPGKEISGASGEKGTVMRALGVLVALAFVAFVVIVGVSVLRSVAPSPPVSLVEESRPVPQSGQAPVEAVNEIETVHTTSSGVERGVCRTVGDGYLETNPVFGNAQASHIHVSYWTPSGPDQRERDVVLPGGRWQRDAGVGGYFWIFADCTETQVREQVELHQARKREELGDRHAGWGDASSFTRID